MRKLFSAEELAEWDASLEQAREVLPSDEVRGRWNEAREVRIRAFSQRWNLAVLQKLVLRPDLPLIYLLARVAYRGNGPFDFSHFVETLRDFRFDDPSTYLDRLQPALDPENIRLCHTLLTAMKHVPQSWAASALTRFFRKTGPQGQEPWASRVGSGALSASQGWVQQETFSVANALYDFPIGDLIMVDLSPDPWGEIADEIADEGGEPFAATTKERNIAMIDTFLALLDPLDMAPAPIVAPPIVKPKNWKQGDRVTAQNVIRLPSGSHVCFKQKGYVRGKPVDETRDMVYLERKGRGKYLIRPIVKGTAFASVEASSGIFNEAIYMGPWEGPILEVEVKWR